MLKPINKAAIFKNTDLVAGCTRCDPKDACFFCDVRDFCNTCDAEWCIPFIGDFD